MAALHAPTTRAASARVAPLPTTPALAPSAARRPLIAARRPTSVRAEGEKSEGSASSTTSTVEPAAAAAPASPPAAPQQKAKKGFFGLGDLLGPIGLTIGADKKAAGKDEVRVVAALCGMRGMWMCACGEGRDIHDEGSDTDRRDRVTRRRVRAPSRSRLLSHTPASAPHSHLFTEKAGRPGPGHPGQHAGPHRPDGRQVVRGEL